MATGKPDHMRGFGLEPAPLPSPLRLAARRPAEGGSTLILDAGGGQNVVVVLGEDGGDATQMWAFIQQQVSGRKTVRM
jgi:hypothetical protein